MNSKDLLEQATIINLREQDRRGKAIETDFVINNIKRTMYYETELELCNKIYDVIKSVESYITNWSVDFLGNRQAYAVFKSTDGEGEFEVTFDTNNGSVLKVETTFSNQTVTPESIELAQKLINLKR